MKKMLSIAMVLLLACGVTVFAQEKAQTEDFYYVNVPVIKVLSQPAGYTVFYRSKQGVDVKQTLIPLKWFKANTQKAVLTYTIIGEDPSLTVFYRGNEVDFVRLTMPKSLANSAWGVEAVETIDPAKFDIEKFTIEY